MDNDTKTFFGSASWPPQPQGETGGPYTISTTNYPSATAIRHDQDKPDWSLIPMDALEEVVRVLEFGAKKYHRDNWRTGEGFKYSRVVNSLLRHTYSWMRGEDRDPESGLSHLAHMGCNILFLLYYNRYKERFKNDDRYKP